MAIEQPIQPKEICSVRYQEDLMMHAQEFYTLQEQVQYDLSNSNTEAFQVSALLDDRTSEQAFFDLKLNYSHPQGQRTLLKAIAGLYENVLQEQILVEDGSEEALLLLLQCLLSPSEHLVIQYPTYPPALEIAVNRSERQVSLWEGNILDNEWQWDLAKLETLCQENTKAIFLCLPHNPTGSLMSESQYQELIQFARERELLLICDEVYRFLEYDPAGRRKPIVESYEKGISIGSLSKAFALPGLRTGWIVINDEEMRDKLISYKSRTTLCNSVVTQYLAEKALERKEIILPAVRSLVANNLKQLNLLMSEPLQGFSQYFDWVPPKAGTVAFLALRNRQNAEPFCYDLAKQAGVLCLPGAMFSYEPHYFRIGFGRDHFGDAVNAIAEYLGR